MLLLVSIFYDSVPLFLRWEKKIITNPNIYFCSGGQVIHKIDR